MSVGVGVLRPHALAIKGGALAAATVLAGAGLLGVATAGPEISGAPFAQVHNAHSDVALVAYPTFAQSLQTLLDEWGYGNLNQVLGALVPGLSVNSQLSDVLASLNPSHLTVGGIGELFGVSLTERLYSSSTSVDSLLGTGSLFLVNGAPIGNADLSDVLDFLLPGSGSHSLSEVASAFGMGSLLSQYGSVINALGLDNMNVENCTITCGAFLNVISNPSLNVNSSLDDWLSGILKVPTTDITQHAFSGLGSTTVLANSAYTLGEYLHTVPVAEGSSTMLDQATLGDLFGLPAGQTWDAYLSNLPLGGSVFESSGVTLGSLTLGGILDDFLPAGSLPIDGTTSVTDLLEALGLLNW